MSSTLALAALAAVPTVGQSVEIQPVVSEKQVPKEQVFELPSNF